jgi:glycosyltransferase involved in cell wall biosynthesis
MVTFAMRVLFVAERFPPQRGGVANAAARQVAALAPELERIDVVNLTADLPPGRVEATEEHGALVHRVGRTARSEESHHLLYQVASALLRRGEHQLVHGFYAVFAGYVAVLAARRAGLPSIVSLRGNDVDMGLFQGSRLSLLQWALDRSSAVTAVSSDLRDKARALCPSQDRLRVIPNSVDADLFSPGEPDPAHITAISGLPRPWVGFSGELRFKKGLPLLLELARDLAEREAGSLLAIGGVRREELEQVRRWRTSEPRAAGRLVELPYLKDRQVLRSHLRAMDLFVFPSLWDGVPNALLEVMACGRPVVAVRAGGIPDVIEPGRSGLLVELDALDQLPAEVERALALPTSARESLGQAARRRVVERFSPAAEKEALLTLYREVGR